MSPKSKPGLKRTKASLDSKKWSTEVIAYLERRIELLDGDEADLEIRYLRTCQLAVASCDQLGINFSD
jgi:hypothetical protein